MGFTEVLTLIFIVLKIFNIIDWNWFFVLLPEIVAVVFYLTIGVIEYFSIKSFHKELKEFWKEDE